jgi:hypothetical protein
MPPWSYLECPGIIIAQAPFAFIRVVPANVRYWYLFSLWMIFLIVGLVKILASWHRGPVRFVFFMIPVLLGLYWIKLLTLNITQHAEAGQLSRAVQSELLSVDANNTDGEPLFVSGYPMVVPSSSGKPVAQVYQWGLRDVVLPPFTDKKVPVYPIPLLGRDRLLPILHSTYGTNIFIWDREAKRLKRSQVTDNGKAQQIEIDELKVLFPKEGSQLSVSTSGWYVLAEGVVRGRGHRILAGPGNFSKVKIPMRQAVYGKIRVDLPYTFILAQ